MALEWKNEHTDRLCDAILSMKDREEVYRFLADIATISEIKALAQRLQVAFMLIDGASYPQIVDDTAASTATISRVKKIVDYGEDGYKTVKSRLCGDKILPPEKKSR